MAREKKNTAFFCQNCGFEAAKWMGQCPGCKEWNTFVEEIKKTASKNTGAVYIEKKNATGPVALREVITDETQRIHTGIQELDRVLGGGIVRGSLTLVGGDPGIGKSTLLLQMCRLLAANGQKVLYVSGEESQKQIKLRADRIGEFSDNLLVYCETALEQIVDSIKSCLPQIVVIDSIQTMSLDTVSSAPGSVSQVREATSVLLQISKGLDIAVFIIGHVTKEGMVAGPRMLEHMVDTVLYFEGETSAAYRILRGVKNRFGSTNEIGVFEMRESGLAEVENPSAYMLSGRPLGESGCVTVCTMEGTRPLLVEIQALVCHTSFGIPRRQSIGTDYNRVNLLLAILEKRLGMQVGSCDAYVNIAGGMKITEPAIDLGILLAVASSFRNRPIKENLVVFGEVGISGEVRGVHLAKQRILEAQKLGFTTCILPNICLENMGNIGGIRLIGVNTVQEAIAVMD